MRNGVGVVFLPLILVIIIQQQQQQQACGYSLGKSNNEKEKVTHVNLQDDISGSEFSDLFLKSLRAMVRSVGTDDGNGRCGEDNTPCITRCTEGTEDETDRAPFGFCLTTLGTAAKCRSSDESCFVVSENLPCVPARTGDGVVVGGCEVDKQQAGVKSSFSRVSLHVTMFLPLLPSQVALLYSSTLTSSRPQGENAEKLEGCLASSFKVHPQDVMVDVALRQADGALVSARVVVSNVQKLADIKGRIEKVLAQGARDVCQQCGTRGFGSLLGQEGSLLNPVVMTYDDDLPVLFVRGFTVSPPHTHLDYARPRIEEYPVRKIHVIVDVSRDPMDSGMVLEGVREMREKQKEIRESAVNNPQQEAAALASSLAILSPECLEKGDEAIMKPEMLGCHHMILDMDPIQFEPYSQRQWRVTFSLSRDQSANLLLLCGDDLCLLHNPSGLFRDTAGRTNRMAVVREITPLIVDFWSIHEEDANSFPASPMNQVRYSIRVKFNRPIDVSSFDSRRFAIGQVGTPSRFKQQLGNGLVASHVEDLNGKIRLDMINIAIEEPSNNPPADIIENIRSNDQKAYLVVADKAIADKAGQVWIDGYGPIEEAHDCFDVHFPDPSVEVSREIRESVQVNGLRMPIHSCAIWSKDPTKEDSGCGSVAADNFCRLQGYGKSMYHGSMVATTTTRTIDSSLSLTGVCDNTRLQSLFNRLCSTFTSVTCCGDPSHFAVAKNLDLCLDHPTGWVDVLGQPCESYEQFPWKCQMAKELAPAESEYSGLEACCACNGGDRYGDSPPEIEAFTISKTHGLHLYFTQPMSNEKQLKPQHLHFYKTNRDKFPKQLDDNSEVVVTVVSPQEAILTGKSVLDIFESSLGGKLLLWGDEELWESVANKKALFGNAELLLQQSDELKLISFSIETYNPPYEKVQRTQGGENTTATKHKKDETETETVKEQQQQQQQQQQLTEPPGDEEIFQILLEFNRPIVAATFDPNRAFVMDSRWNNDPLALSNPIPTSLDGARILHSRIQSPTVFAVLSRDHPVSQMLLEKERKLVELVSHPDSVSDVDEYEYVYLNPGAVKEAGGPILSSGIDPSKAIRDTALADEGESEHSSELRFEKIVIGWDDPAGQARLSSEFENNVVGSVPIFHLAEAEFVKLREISIHFSNAPAFVRISKFQSNQGWVSIARTAGWDIGETSDQKRLTSDGQLITTARPAESPYQALMNLPFDDGANVFLIELSQNNPNLPVDVQFIGLILVKSCGQSTFTLPLISHNGVDLPVGANVLLHNAQTRAAEFCRYHKKSQNGATCAGDFNQALPLYKSDTMREWRSEMVPKAVMKDTREWCKGGYQGRETLLCQTGRTRQQSQCDKNATTETQTSRISHENMKWCSEKEDERQTNGAAAVGDLDNPPECCFAFKHIQCDVLRIETLRAKGSGGSEFSFYTPSTSPTTTTPFDPDSFIYFLDKRMLDSQTIQFEAILRHNNNNNEDNDNHKKKANSNEADTCLGCHQSEKDEIVNVDSIFVTGEREGGVGGVQIDLDSKSGVPGGEIKVVPLLNVALLEVVRGPHSVQYAVVIGGEGDGRCPDKRHHLSLKQLAVSWADVTRLPTNSTTLPDASIDFCNDLNDVSTCGQAAADSLCMTRLGNEALSITARAETFGVRKKTARTVDLKGNACETSFDAGTNKWKNCFTFESVTCSTFAGTSSE